MNQSNTSLPISNLSVDGAMLSLTTHHAGVSDGSAMTVLFVAGLVSIALLAALAIFAVKAS